MPPAAERPPGGRPSRPSTVSATLSPSACWLYLRQACRLRYQAAAPPAPDMRAALHSACCRRTRNNMHCSMPRRQHAQPHPPSSSSSRRPLHSSCARRRAAAASQWKVTAWYCSFSRGSW